MLSGTFHKCGYPSKYAPHLLWRNHGRGDEGGKGDYFLRDVLSEGTEYNESNEMTSFSVGILPQHYILFVSRLRFVHMLLYYVGV